MAVRHEFHHDIDVGVLPPVFPSSEPKMANSRTP